MVIVVNKPLKQRFLLFCATLWTILISGTAYFSTLNYSIYVCVYCLVISAVTLYLRLNIKKFLRNITFISPFLLLFIINILLYGESLTSRGFNTIVSSVISMVFTALFITVIDTKTFVTLYIRIIVAICMISIPCFIVLRLTPNLAMLIASKSIKNGSQYLYSFFYTWGWSSLFTRNAGPYWEPGVFQAFIILAFMCLIYRLDGGNIKKRKSTILLFTVTQLTTQSTTGYIILTTLLFSHFSFIKNILRVSKKNGSITKQKRILVTVFSIIFVLMILCVIISSKNIEEKLNSSNASAVIRQGDFMGGIALVKRAGLFGLGETPTTLRIRAQFGISINNSNIVFYNIYTYGIIFGIYYFYFVFKGMLLFFNPPDKKRKFILAMVFLILYMSEGISFLPVFLTVSLIGLTKRRHLNRNVEE